MSLKKFVAVVLLGVAVFSQPAFAQKYVCMQSNLGEWCIEMLHSSAPNTAANFLRYVNNNNYTDSLVHRSEPGFVIQGGALGWDSNNDLFAIGNFGNINNEFGLSNTRGTVAMARLSGQPHSGSNQWFINLADNTSLDTIDGGFTVFARVAYGMDVVDRIAGLRVVDLSGSVAIFTNFPTTSQGSTINRADAVIISRAYATDVLPGDTLLPYHCTPNVPQPAVTEFCNNAISLPVQIEGGSYEATLELVTAEPMVFALKPGSLRAIAALPASYATFDPLSNEVVIPSVRVGASMYDAVKLKFNGTQFTLTGFTPRL